MKNFNPFFTQNMIALNAKKAGKRSRRRVRRMDGAALTTAPEAVDGIRNLAESAGAAKLIQTGRRSFHNTETPLHQNAVVLKLVNNSAVRADLVLSAGSRSSETEIAAQLIAEGTADYVNDDSATASVTVAASFGIRGTTNSWDRILRWINEKGLAINATRFSYDTKAQQMHPLRLQRDDLFDDYINDQISPFVYYDASNFDLMTVQSDIAYQLDDDTVLYYSIEPETEVLLTFWIGGAYDKNRHLANYIRNNSVNSLG